MAITKNNTIPKDSLAHNPIELDLTTDNQFSVAGSKAVLVLDVAAPIDEVVDHGFTIDWGDISIAFVSKAVPDDSGTQFLNTAANAPAQIANIVAVFNINYYITRDHVITYDASSITLTAKEKGTDYSFSMLVPITLTSLTVGSNTAGVDQVARSFFEILVQTLLSDGTLLGQDVLTPDENGNAIFDVSVYLRAQLEGSSAFKWTEDTSTFLIDRSASNILFYLQYAEKFDGVIQGITSTVDDATYALNGGYDSMEKARMFDEGSSFLEQINYTWQFLTQQPAEKIINFDQPEKLFYLVWKDDTTSIKLKVKIYYTDGTDTTITKATQAVSQYQVWECVVSPDKMELDLVTPAKTIDYYEIWIDDQDDDRVSKIQKYTIDREYYEHQRYLIFRNSFGEFDITRFTGIKTDNLEHAREVDSYNPGDGWDQRFKAENITEQQSFAINTGWMLNKETLDWLRDLLISPEVYEIINNRLYPIIIQNTKTFKQRDKEDLFALAVEYIRAYTDQHYTRDATIYPEGTWGPGMMT